MQKAVDPGGVLFPSVLRCKGTHFFLHKQGKSQFFLILGQKKAVFGLFLCFYMFIYLYVHIFIFKISQKFLSERELSTLFLVPKTPK